MQEIWKDIQDYEGIYQVSNLGNVRSLDKVIMRSHGEKLSVRGRVLKPVILKGYYYVRLNDVGKFKTKSVHRLVAKAFISNELNLPEVNHKDENKLNNIVTNLEWCDRLYNVNYVQRACKFSKTMKGRFAGCKNPMYGKPGTFKGKHHSEKVRQHLSEKATGKIWINKDGVTKRICANELDNYLLLGYKRGRI